MVGDVASGNLLVSVTLESGAVEKLVLQLVGAGDRRALTQEVDRMWTPGVG